MRLALLLAALLVATSGCGWEKTDARATCRMLGHLFAGRIARECSSDGDYEGALKSINDALQPGAVTALRDRDELYAKCLPALAKTPCHDIVAGKVPTSCMGQCQR